MLSPRPVALIPLVIHHLMAYQARTILIVPVWERNKYWGLLCPDHVHTGPTITRFYALTARGNQPDIAMGPIGRPDFLVQASSRHHHEWVALMIDTTLGPRSAADLRSPPFCIRKHYGKKCCEC